MRGGGADLPAIRDQMIQGFGQEGGEVPMLQRNAGARLGVAGQPQGRWFGTCSAGCDPVTADAPRQLPAKTLQSHAAVLALVPSLVSFRQDLRGHMSDDHRGLYLITMLAAGTPATGKRQTALGQQRGFVQLTRMWGVSGGQQVKPQIFKIRLIG